MRTDSLRSLTPSQIDSMGTRTVKPRTELKAYWKHMDNALMYSMRYTHTAYDFAQRAHRIAIRVGREDLAQMARDLMALLMPSSAITIRR